MDPISIDALGYKRDEETLTVSAGLTIVPVVYQPPASPDP